MSPIYSPQHQIIPGIYKTNFDGLFFININKHPDYRGFYSELARIPELNQILDQPFNIKQINLSHSEKNVIRGLHAENWRKLVTVTHGQALCNLVDIRPESTTFGQYQTFNLGPSHQHGCLFIPIGVANSFYIPDQDTDYLYFVDELYQNRDTQKDVSINLFDSDINIDWPVTPSQAIISQRDLNCANLRDLFPNKFK